MDSRLDQKIIAERRREAFAAWERLAPYLTLGAHDIEGHIALDIVRAIAEAPEPEFVGGMPDFDVEIVRKWWLAARACVGGSDE